MLYNRSKLMKPLVARIKPANGLSGVFHYVLLLVFPLLLFMLVRLDFIQLAYILVVLSKWRMLAVRPRFWLANIRSNSVDMMVGFSTLVFMTHTGSAGWQLVWALVYAAWLIFLKPGSSVFYTSLQAGVGFLFGLMAMFIAWSGISSYGLVLVTGLICYLVARHFFDSFDEPYAKLLSYLWGYFGAALMWVLAHILIVYPHRSGIISQPMIFLLTIGVALATVYYWDHFDKFARFARKEVLFISGSIVVILLISLYYEGNHLLLR